MKYLVAGEEIRIFDRYNNPPPSSPNYIPCLKTFSALTKELSNHMVDDLVQLGREEEE